MNIPEITTINSHMHDELVSKAAKSFKWSILYNVAPRVVTSFSTMVLAALLTPADFGLVAISTFVIAFASILSELGLGRTVIQRRTEFEESATASFWLSLIMSLGIYLVLWIVAPQVSLIYANSRVTEVLRVAGLSLPLGAITTVPKALFRRNMQFNILFWVNSSLLVVTAMVSVVLAFLGAGVWAVILGQLMGMATSSGIVWAMVKWHPKLIIDLPTLRSLLGFSAWIMLSNIQNWLLLYADNVIASIFLGVQGLGVYVLGFNIATLIPTFLIASISDVAYPAFCKLEGDRQEVGKSLVSLQRLTGAFLFPIALGISAIASPTVELLYGNKWQGLGTVISILVILPGLSNIWTLNESAYTSVGKPDIYTKLSALSLLLLLPTLWFIAPHGLLIFTVARFLGAIFLPIGNIFMSRRTLHISITSQLKSLISPLIPALAMFVLVSLLIWRLGPFEGSSGWIKLLSAVLTGVVIYLLMTRYLNRDLWNDLLMGVRRIFAR
jgi:teichuronic acid exporter